jgi:hypothetical protein
VSDLDEYPRFSTLYESRAYRARMAALEADDEFIDDLNRAESEADDFIRELETLAEQSGDMHEAIKLVQQAKAIVVARRHIAEKCR